MRLLSLIAGVLLLAAVLFVIRDLSRPHPHEPMGGGGAEPAPDDDPARPGPSQQ